VYLAKELAWASAGFLFCSKAWEGNVDEEGERKKSREGGRHELLTIPCIIRKDNDRSSTGQRCSLLYP